MEFLLYNTVILNRARQPFNQNKHEHTWKRKSKRYPSRSMNQSYSWKCNFLAFLWKRCFSRFSRKLEQFTFEVHHHLDSPGHPFRDEWIDLTACRNPNFLGNRDWGVLSKKYTFSTKMGDLRFSLSWLPGNYSPRRNQENNEQKRGGLAVSPTAPESTNPSGSLGQQRQVHGRMKYMLPVFCFSVLVTGNVDKRQTLRKLITRIFS